VLRLPTVEDIERELMAAFGGASLER
jgi:hypothetical protein